MARIWCEVLDLEEVSIHDNFLDLGGQSLLATRIISRLQRVSANRVNGSKPLRESYDRELLGACRERRRGKRLLRCSGRSTGKNNFSCPLPSCGYGFWTSSNPIAPFTTSPKPGFSMAHSTSLHSRRASMKIVRRHEGLRTTFVAVNGQPVQVVSSAVRIVLEPTDLSPLSESEQTDETLRLASAEAGPHSIFPRVRYFVHHCCV